MAAPEQKIPPVKKKSRHEPRLTVMIMRSVGKVHTFKISPRMILCVTIFFLLYIPISIWHINGFWIKRRQNITQSEKLTKLERETSEDRRLLNRSKQHIALLEDYIHNLEERQEQEDEPLKGEDSRELKTASRVEDQIKEMDREDTPAKVVDIEDMVIQKEGSRVTVNFKLVNVHPGEGAVGGYIHIIAKAEKSDPPKEWTYPTVTLRSGIPTNYRRGQLFLIQRFKPIEGKLNLERGSKSPSSIRVLVYDQSGRTLLEKTFKVSNGS